MGKCVRRRGRKKKLIVRVSAFLLVLAVGIWAHVHFNVRPVLRRISEEEVRAMAATAVNEAALKIMSGEVDYNSILEVEKNSAGDVVLIRAKPVELNAIARNVTLLTQNYLTQMGQQGIHVPWGTLTGLAFLSGKGSAVSFNILPMGSANSKFTSGFQSMGINQTRHQIYMDVSTGIQVIIPGMSFELVTVTQVPIAEAIIVGKVPDTYLQSSSLDEMLNLIP